jgi:hypothetical protein
MPRQVRIKKVYDKASHYRKGNYAPVESKGTLTKDRLDVTIHMTPELKHKPTERKVLLRHEVREAHLIAQGKSVKVAHRKAVAKDPEWLKGEKGYKNIWERLGKKKPKF